MLGREAVDAIARSPIGYLPVGCLERHGDHLPMGLDTLKAHGVCCLAARLIGGVVFPPHHYAGVHGLTRQQLRTYTTGWGNLYTDATAEGHLIDLCRQIELLGVRVLTLYTGHYPGSQTKMIRRVADHFVAPGGLRIVPFWDKLAVTGDHAGVSETSLMMYVDRGLVDTTRIGAANHADHTWDEARAPEKAGLAEGERQALAIVERLREEIRGHMPCPAPGRRE